MSTRLSKQLLYESLYGENTFVLDKEAVRDFINESSQVQGVYSDEGLYDFFASFADYKRVQSANALKILGWPVVDYLLDEKAMDPFYLIDMMEDDGPTGSEGRVDTNTYGGAVIAGERSFKQTDKLYMKEMDRIMKNLGWEIVKYMGVGPNRKSKVVIIPSYAQTTMPGKVNEDIVFRINVNESRNMREEEHNIEKIVAVYPGRFQPFGPHHLESYKFLKRRFDEVYIVTSGKTGGARHPMNFAQKKKHMIKMGVPSKAIVQEKQPYIPKGLLSKYDGDSTAVVFAVGEKDEGRLTSGKYFKPYRKNYNRLQGFDNHGYTLQIPHTSIKVGGMEISGTTMRKLMGSDKFDLDKKKQLLYHSISSATVSASQAESLPQFLVETRGEDVALKYFEKNIYNFKNKSNKILYDIGNIYKKFKNYKKAIEYYSKVLSRIDNNSSTFADILYRRGGAFERMGDYDRADIDLLKSLEIRPDDPYTLNYLAYSWLERNHKIDEAIQMLEKAYIGKENDPYITDSVGWGYYLIGDYERAEKYLRRAVELMPEDPIVNDHYGDVLWQLDRKMQAGYFWKNVLQMQDAEEKMKKDIQSKLINGPNKI